MGAEPVSVSIVTPLYNEADLAGACCRGMMAALGELSAVSSFQIVFVDDGSTDGTTEALRRGAGGDPRVEIIRLPHNVGQHQATLVGLAASVGDVVITLDADLRVSGEQINALLRPFLDDPKIQVVCGARRARPAGLARGLASRVLTVVANRMCRSRLRDPGSAIAAMRREVVDGALTHPVLAQNLPFFIAFAGFTIHEVPFDCQRRSDRQSRYRPAGLLMILMLALLNYSSGARALAVLLTVGMALTGAGAAALLAMLGVSAASQVMLSPWYWTLAATAILFGGQFLALSLMGYKLEALNRNLRLRELPIQLRVDHRPRGGARITREADALRSDTVPTPTTPATPHQTLLSQ